jgi:transposase
MDKEASMYFAGIDLHGKYSVVVVLDSDGARVVEGRIPNQASSVRAFFGGLEEPVRAVVESTGNWHWLYDLLEAEGVETLAHLLRTDLVPASYAPPREVRELRELIRFRASLVRSQTRLKSRVRWLLAKRDLRLQARTLMSRAGRAELEALELPGLARREVDQTVGLLEHLAECVRELDGEIRRRSSALPEAKLLETVPGVGPLVALLIVAEVGDIERFASARKLASYAGLVPTTRSSGGRTYHGRITKQGSAWLRWAMVQAALHAIRKPGPIRSFYRRQARRKGPKIARVAAARKLLTQIYWVWRNEEPYPAMVKRLQAAEVSSQSYVA